MEEIVLAVEAALRQHRTLLQDAGMETPEVVARLEALDATHFRRPLVVAVSEAVQRRLAAAGSCDERGLWPAQEDAAAVAARFVASSHFRRVVDEVRGLVAAAAASSFAPSVASSAADREVSAEWRHGSEDGDGVLIIGDGPDEVWSEEGTDKRAAMYSLVLETLDDDELRRMIKASGELDFGPPSDAAAREAMAAHRAQPPLVGANFVEALDAIAPCDVMQFERWDRVAQKLAQMLPLPDDDAPLVHLARLFAASAGEQALVLYRLLLQHVAGLHSGDPTLGAKVTILWRMQMELPEHWTCCNDAVFGGLLQDTLAHYCRRHLYAAGVVDPYASWAALWLRCPGIQCALRDRLREGPDASVEDGLLAVLQAEAAAGNSHGLALLCCFTPFAPAAARTEQLQWLAGSRLPRPEAPNGPEASVESPAGRPAMHAVVASCFVRCGGAACEVLASHLDALVACVRRDRGLGMPLLGHLLTHGADWLLTKGASAKAAVLALVDALNDADSQEATGADVAPVAHSLVATPALFLSAAHAAEVVTALVRTVDCHGCSRPALLLAAVLAATHRPAAVVLLRAGERVRNAVCAAVVDAAGRDALAPPALWALMCADEALCSELVAAAAAVMTHSDVNATAGPCPRALARLLGRCNVPPLNEPERLQRRRVCAQLAARALTSAQLLAAVHDPHAAAAVAIDCVLAVTCSAADGGGVASEDDAVWLLAQACRFAVSPLVAPRIAGATGLLASVEAALRDRVLDAAECVPLGWRPDDGTVPPPGEWCGTDAVTLLLHLLQLLCHGVGGPRERLLPIGAVAPILRHGAAAATIPEAELEDVVVTPRPVFEERFPRQPPGAACAPPPALVRTRIAAAAAAHGTAHEHFTELLAVSAVEAAKPSNARARPGSSAPLLFKRRGVSAAVLRRFQEAFVRQRLLGQPRQQEQEQTLEQELAAWPKTQRPNATGIAEAAARYAAQLGLFEAAPTAAQFETALASLPPTPATHAWFPAVVLLLLGLDVAAAGQLLEAVDSGDCGGPAGVSPLQHLRLFRDDSEASRALLDEAASRLDTLLRRHHPTTRGALLSSPEAHPQLLLRRWCGQCFVSVVDFADVCNVLLATALYGPRGLAAISAAALHDSVSRSRARCAVRAAAAAGADGSGGGGTWGDDALALDVLLVPFAEDFRLGAAWPAIGATVLQGDGGANP